MISICKAGWVRDELRLRTISLSDLQTKTRSLYTDQMKLRARSFIPDRMSFAWLYAEQSISCCSDSRCSSVIAWKIFSLLRCCFPKESPKSLLPADDLPKSSPIGCLVSSALILSESTPELLELFLSPMKSNGLTSRARLPIFSSSPSWVSF